MKRPTALIRRILLLDELETRINDERRKIKQLMREHKVRIIDQIPDGKSMSVIYEAEGKQDTAIYMDAMIVAEARGIVRLRDIEKELNPKPPD